jgi:hypothetical protein
MWAIVLPVPYGAGRMMIRDGMEAFVRTRMDGDDPVAKVGLEATQERIRARMDWLDDQPSDFRAMVHEIGLNRACLQTGRRPPV